MEAEERNFHFEQAAELPPRDKDNFYPRYNIEESSNSYHVWELAELASVKSEVFGEPDPEELKKVQRQRIKYRDANTKLLSTLSNDETDWSNWLTHQRVKQLNDLAKKLETY